MSFSPVNKFWIKVRHYTTNMSDTPDHPIHRKPHNCPTHDWVMKSNETKK